MVFGPPEYFALMFMGLSLVISLSGRALLKGIISMALGLTAALIGQDPLTGAARLTFGSVTDWPGSISSASSWGSSRSAR